MKKIVFLVELFILVTFSSVYLFAGSVRADDVWKGPGWYVVAYQYAVILWSGPYPTKEECEQAKPADGDPPNFEYSCSRIDHAPLD
jgi:hypothetical protein